MASARKMITEAETLADIGYHVAILMLMNAVFLIFGVYLFG
ncbi:MAG: hypothetical protein ACJAXS_002737 [Colwellia sp.]